MAAPDKELTGGARKWAVDRREIKVGRARSGSWRVENLRQRRFEGHTLKHSSRSLRPAVLGRTIGPPTNRSGDICGERRRRNAMRRHGHTTITSRARLTHRTEWDCP